MCVCVCVPLETPSEFILYLFRRSEELNEPHDPMVVVGKKEDILPYAKAPHDALNFIHDTVLDCALKVPESHRHRALDIGCAVGGSTFELARYFDQVLGIDFSHSFIETSNAMKARGELWYDAVTEGRQTESRLARVSVSNIERERVQFAQGDACTLLKDDMGTFDAVLASNLLCRVPEPEIFLRSLKDLVNEGGVVALISPYSWLEEYTDESKWLGGQVTRGDKTKETVATILAPDFELLEEQEYPFLIREHARKYQWGTSEGTFWKKRKP